MSSFCPYCGAALKLKFCVVCGRQSKLNKMGQIRNQARNSDATQRLEDPLLEESVIAGKSLRFQRKVKPYIGMALGFLVIVGLMISAVTQVMSFYGPEGIDHIVSPWMKSRHFVFPKEWLSQDKQTPEDKHWVDQHKKKQRRNKGKTKPKHN